MANSVDPDQTAPIGNYLQQTTSADNIFRCIFFLGALRVEYLYDSKLWLSVRMVLESNIEEYHACRICKTKL